MTILDPSDFEAVRKAIDVSLDDASLPNATLALPTYQGVAEAYVRSRIPNADALVAAGGPSAQRVKNAAIFTLAASVVRFIPHLVRETVVGVTIERQRVDIDALETRLRGLAEIEIGEETGEVPSARRPAFFALAKGSRGRLLAPRVGPSVVV